MLLKADAVLYESIGRGTRSWRVNSGRGWMCSWMQMQRRKSRNCCGDDYIHRTLGSESDGGFEDLQPMVCERLSERCWNKLFLNLAPADVHQCPIKSKAQSALI